MRHIQTIHDERYEDDVMYDHVEDKIYKNLMDESEAKYRVAVSYELEEDEDSQYPLEDVMHEYNVYVSEFLDGDLPQSGTTKIELAGTLDEIRALVAGIVGKRVRTTYEADENGDEYAKLVIEDEATA